MKVLIIAGYTPSLINFRGDLIREITHKGHEIIVVAPEAGYDREIADLGARFIRIPFGRAGSNPIEDFGLIIKLYNLIGREKPNLVFSYTIKPVIYGSIAASLKGIRQTYAMVTGLGYTFVADGFKASFIRVISKFLYYIAIKCCTRVFFQNPDDIEQFIQSGLISKDKCILVNGSGVNLLKFANSPMPNNHTFLMICRILRDKGVIEYLEAARRVKRKYPQVEFQLMGPLDVNPNALSYENIKTYTEDGSVTYLGEIKDVRPYLEKCSVYVLPSYREGTPRTVLEAMAVGRPIITTDAPGCRETVVDGVNGFLVPTKDVSELEKKFIWMIEHPIEVEKMASASIRICREKYDVRLVNNVMISTMNL